MTATAPPVTAFGNLAPSREARPAYSANASSTTTSASARVHNGPGNQMVATTIGKSTNALSTRVIAIRAPYLPGKSRGVVRGSRERNDTKRLAPHETLSVRARHNPSAVPAIYGYVP